MWVTNTNVRELYRSCFCREATIYGLGQKGIHMDEADNQALPSLEIEGCPAVALKENHAATRTRVSAMTHVCSEERYFHAGRRLAY